MTATRSQQNTIYCNIWFNLQSDELLMSDEFLMSDDLSNCFELAFSNLRCAVILHIYNEYNTKFWLLLI